ncbi:MAG: RNA polymerase sigma factor, partial [Spirochaetota bacterium]
RIFNYFRLKTSDGEAARELTHDTFLKVLEQGRIEEMNELTQKSYLQKCAHNKLVDYYKTLSRKRALIDKLRSEYKCMIQTPDTEETLFIKADLERRLNYLILHSLTPSERDIFYRRYFSYESIHSICSHTGMSRYRVERALNSINGRIRERISYYYTGS